MQCRDAGVTQMSLMVSSISRCSSRPSWCFNQAARAHTHTVAARPHSRAGTSSVRYDLARARRAPSSLAQFWWGRKTAGQHQAAGQPDQEGVTFGQLHRHRIHQQDPNLVDVNFPSPLAANSHTQRAIVLATGQNDGTLHCTALHWQCTAYAIQSADTFQWCSRQKKDGYTGSDHGAQD